MRFVLADIDPVALAKLAIVPMAVVLVVGEAYALRTIRRRPLGSVVGRRVSATGYSAQNVIGSAGIGVAAKVVGLALAVPTLAISAMHAPLSHLPQALPSDDTWVGIAYHPSRNPLL